MSINNNSINDIETLYNKIKAKIASQAVRLDEFNSRQNENTITDLKKRLEEANFLLTSQVSIITDCQLLKFKINDLIAIHGMFQLTIRWENVKKAIETELKTFSGVVWGLAENVRATSTILKVQMDDLMSDEFNARKR